MRTWSVTNRLTPSCERNIVNLKKKYPKIERDLRELFREIARDYRTKCGGRAIVGCGGGVWKYRCRSTDQRKGRSGGFRVICLIREQDSTIHPLVVYAKSRHRKEFTPAKILALAKRVDELST